MIGQKDLLGLRGMDREQLTRILDAADSMRRILDQNQKKMPHLQGKTIVTLFYENSTRTRLSFELAAKYMSANAANISASSSSVAKGETLIDTGRTIQMMGTDVVVMRHPMAGAPHLLGKHVDAAVINAGDGMHEHPTQALLDMYTVRRKRGSLMGLKVAIIGDITHSRVARSNIWGMQAMGAEVWLCGPATLMPVEIEKTGARVCTRVEEAIEGADVVMGLRLQKERQQGGLIPTLREYASVYGINNERMRLAKQDAVIMHPGPINRGVEMMSDVADRAESVIDEQVKNGVAVRMALLYLMTRRREPHDLH